VTYVDGFVLVVPRDQLEAYREQASTAGKIWMEHGAIGFFECLADDTAAEGMTPFPQLMKAGEDELVLFSYIVYESRERRNEVNGKVMADPRIKNLCGPETQVFDVKRMAYGGFRAIVEFGTHGA
jgi:uncharacterized protein YbaA (DUF1428 family)